MGRPISLVTKLATKLATLMVLLLLNLVLVTVAGLEAWQASVAANAASTSTNARLDRNLVYLKCSFQHLDNGQQRISRGLPAVPNPCVASHR